MAAKLKAATEGAFLKKIPEIRRAITDANKHKEKAAEYNGLAGKTTANAVDGLNVNRWSFTAVAQLLKKDPTEQQARALTFFALCLELGVLDQVDVFDDKLDVIAQRIAELTSPDAASPPPATSPVVAMLNGPN